MSWELRHHNKKYFYKKQRVNGKLVRVYLGRGPVAELFAAADAQTADARAAERADLDTLRDEFTRIERILDHQEKLLRLFTHAHLIHAGYHNHQGQWRKRREKIL